MKKPLRDYTEDPLYKTAMQKAEAAGERVPESLVLQVHLPFDCYVSFIRRFYSDPEMRFRHNQNKVTKKDIIAHLLWAWGNRFDVNLSGNTFEQIDPGMTREVKHGTKQRREGSNPVGRPPKKHLIGLFDSQTGKEQPKSEE